jgi:hypothetical protein
MQNIMAKHARVTIRKTTAGLKSTFLLVVLLMLSSLTPSHAQQTSTSQQRPRMDVYGFAMLDLGYDVKQVDPDWFDVVRPTKLPSFEDEFGKDGTTYAGVRQSRLGVKGYVPTSLGELRTTFEFELFGTGVDAGQTTFRLRHAYGELGDVGAGQTWSPFMDPDVFPNSVEYWGPNGMVFFRNVQVRWMPVQGDSRVTIALERPGASGDGGVYADRIEIQNIRPHFPLPDLSGEARFGRPWGYFEVAAIIRRIRWDDLLDDQFDLNGNDTGWGVNVSSNIKFGPKNVAKLQVVYGEGVQNYMNDAPADIGLVPNPGNPVRPVEGAALPIFGLVAFYDHYWSDMWSTSLGYSRVDIENSSLQAPSAFNTGQYGLVNLLHYPVENVMMGAEGQWGRRDNFSDGWSVDDYRIQFSFRYNFSMQFGGTP